MGLSLPRFDFGFRFSGASHIGRVRENNQDAWRADLEVGAFAIADGMGGHAAGEVAAAMGLEVLLRSLRVREAQASFDQFLAGPSLEARRQVFAVLKWAAQQANAEVRAEARKNHNRAGMGATLDAALLLGTAAFVLHTGDARVYVARPSATVQLTQDHTFTNALLASGRGTPSQPPPGPNALTSALGTADNTHFDELYIELSQGDRLLLCTDGVYRGFESEDEIARLTRHGGPAEAVHALISEALERGGRDNATAVIVEVEARHTHRNAGDGGLRTRDRAVIAQSALLEGLNDKQLASVMGTTVEVEVREGKTLPRFATEDRVAYIVLEGEVSTPEGWLLGPSALLYPESLAGAGKGPELVRAQSPVRAVRLRRNDFREVCSADVALAAHLYERLASLLARRDSATTKSDT